MRNNLLLALAGLAAIGGCTPRLPVVEGPPAIPPPPPDAAPTPKQCAVSQSSGWTARISPTPGPNNSYTLFVNGKVTVPTGGYSFQWRDPIVMESSPLQVVVELLPVPPTGMATQAFATHDVHGEWAMRGKVGSLTITCGTRTLARPRIVQSAR